jgi:hypothetical protein
MLIGYQGPCAGGACRAGWISADSECWLTDGPHGACSPQCAARANARLGTA